ncbi:MAG: DUF3829 domain-containing protein [Myxococcota bacterium]
MSGCRSSPEPPVEALPDVEAAATAPRDVPVDAATAQRDYLAQWSRCLSRTGGRLARSWARLERDIDVEKLRVRTRGVQPWFDAVEPDLLRSCPLGDDVPAGVDASVPKQGRAFVLAARGYGNRAAELRAYFDTEAYVSDDWETMKRTLPELATAHEAAHGAADTFARTLGTALDAADDAWLAELGDDGKTDTAPWHVVHTAKSGRATLACITAALPLPPDCKSAAQTFAAAREGLEQYREAHRAEVVGIFWFDVFRLRAADLSEAVAALEAPRSRRKKTADAQGKATATRVAQARAELQAARDTVSFDFP